MCSQCSQRVKNSVKPVLSTLRVGYTFGTHGYIWLHVNILFTFYHR